MATYTTPGANETEQFNLTVTAQNIKAGDRFGGEVVASVKVATKWVHITFKSDRTTKLELGAETYVVRTRVTEAAEKLRSLEYAAEQLAKKLEYYRKGDQAVAKAIEAIEAQFLPEQRYSLGNQANYLADLLTAQARRSLQDMAVRMFDDKDSDVKGDVIAVFKKMRDAIRYEVLRSGRYSSVFSRSTSVMTNLAEDVELDVRVKFLSDIEWEMLAIDKAS